MFSTTSKTLMFGNDYFSLSSIVTKLFENGFHVLKYSPDVSCRLIWMMIIDNKLITTIIKQLSEENQLSNHIKLFFSFFLNVQVSSNPREWIVQLSTEQRWAVQRDCPAGPRARGVTERAGRDFLKLSRGGRGTGVVLSRRSGAGRTF